MENIDKHTLIAFVLSFIFFNYILVYNNISGEKAVIHCIGFVSLFFAGLTTIRYIFVSYPNNA